jgi:hypothetical protein
VEHSPHEASARLGCIAQKLGHSRDEKTEVRIGRTCRGACVL